ncbi:MAG: type I pullulanase [Erysipelotrichaceae bacterium]|nr:type I pullulanase [Erysipelotrichaceae bacterium]
MKETFLNAKLVQPDLIRLVVFSSLSWERIEPTLIVDGVARQKLTPTRLNTLSTLAIADFRLDAPLELGRSYFLCMAQYGSVALDVTDATYFPDFDERFFYDGDDLGAVYSKKETRFALWAPLASKVILGYRDSPKEPFQPVNMIRTDAGVFRCVLKGDHAGAEYHYYVTNSEVTHRTPDPYAKASIANGRESVVADFSRLKEDFHRECLPVCESYSDAVIYETHVRDFTIHSGTNIVHKGRFLGMVEQGRKTKGGNPAGLDYLLSLGVTHVQLLPIYDYKTVDEEHPETGYNWGYDPYQYFVPEGSYASVLLDPLSRIRDCKKMVAEFHKHGLRVIMDVVYNHVFEYEKSTFERIVPNYYFRHRNNGKMANTSGCGDDLASERPMVRKLIVDACKWWIDEYGIDGFRFDLMGIIDCDTLKEISAYGLAKHKSFILYGEGWNMGGEVKQPLGHMGNYRLLPEYGFFNDFYRESLKEYFCENRGVTGNVENVLVGSCTDFNVGAKFLSANQTVNYVECHDNGTIFDHFARRRGDLSEEERLRLVEAINAAVIFSIGIPFIHMGQEIGLTKYGEDNTYNKGDHFNQMDYALLDKRFDMSKRLAEAIKLRKNLRCFHIFDPRVIGPSINVEEVGDAIRLSFVDSNLIAPIKELSVYINVTGHEVVVPVEPQTSVSFGTAEITCFENGAQAHIPPRSVVLLRRG